MAIPTIPQSWRRLLFILPLAIVTFAVITGFFDESLRPPIPAAISHLYRSRGPIYQECHPLNESNSFDALPSVIQQLWAPLALPITEPTFKTLDGTVKALPPAAELVHAAPLGRRVCILDVDTRPLDEAGNVFSAKGLPSWDALEPNSAGFLSHYLYAQIHNYTYKLMRAPEYADRAPHWTKVIFTQELLKRPECEVVVMLDYDAMFPSPEVPIEWMLNYWKIDRDVIVAMAQDPDVKMNRDLRGNLNVNTGFIIAQRVPRETGEMTQALFRDWAECPTETRYKGCAQWKGMIFHEQSGFSSHVRYDFLGGLSVETEEGRKHVRTLPCNEANGVPQTKDLGCVGQLVRHYWGYKASTVEELREGIMRGLTPLLARAAFRGPQGGTDGVVEDFRDMRLEGDRILEKGQAEEGKP